MKKNTQKLLLSLYSPTIESKNRLELSKLNIIVPNLTKGGVRSLIHVLRKNDYINSERVLGVTSIGITQYGVQALEAKFPALSSKWDLWQGNWSCLVFVKAPKNDKQFRYLRSLLIAQGAISISRGVYIAPDSFSQKVVDECKQMYRNSILMFSIGDFQIASFRSLIVKKYGLLDFLELYSGISKDISKLLTAIDVNNEPISRHKDEINLVYDRLQDVLSEDPGFCQYYFDRVPRVKKMLLDLNYLISQH